MKILNTILEKYKNYENIDICEIVKKHGLEVIEFDLGKIDGILFKNTIGVQKNIDKKQKRFVVAHEFCHFLLGEKSFSNGIYHSLDIKEKRADEFATNLLLPKNIFLDTYNEFQNIPTLSEMFGVPEKVIEMRLNSLLIK